MNMQCLNYHLDYIERVINSCKTKDQFVNACMWIRTLIKRRLEDVQLSNELDRTCRLLKHGYIDFNSSLVHTILHKIKHLITKYSI